MKFPPHIGKFPARALARLLKGQELTHIRFQHETASYRLAVAIERLRNCYGWPIKSRDRVGTTSDPVGRSATYSVYFLDIDEIRKAGVMGERFASKVFRWEQWRKEGGAATPHSSTETHTLTHSTSSDINISASKDVSS